VNIGRAFRWFLALAIVLGVVSCSEHMPSEPLVGTPAYSGVPTDSLLAANLALWTSSGIDAYKYRFAWGCFCNPEYVRQVDITVVGGKIVSVADAATGLPLAPEDAAHYRTIDGLFDFIRESMDYPADQILVSFNRTLGFPSSAYVDYRAIVADDELSFGIDRLVRIRPPI
jgi:uncharacterized protein DUF6174